MKKIHKNSKLFKTAMHTKNSCHRLCGNVRHANEPSLTASKREGKKMQKKTPKSPIKRVTKARSTRNMRHKMAWKPLKLSTCCVLPSERVGNGQLMIT
jgi:hypothetical protein